MTEEEASSNIKYLDAAKNAGPEGIHTMAETHFFAFDKLFKNRLIAGHFLQLGKSLN